MVKTIEIPGQLFWFFSENYFIWPIKNIIEGYFYYGFTMVLPGFTMVLPWDYRVLPWYDCGDAMVLKCYDITYKLYAMELPW